MATEEGHLFPIYGPNEVVEGLLMMVRDGTRIHYAFMGSNTDDDGVSNPFIAIQMDGKEPNVIRFTKEA